MAKKARDVPKEPSSGAVPSRDVLQRLSYLYQASTFLSTSLSRSTAPVAAPVTDSVNRLIPTQVGQEDVKGKGREDDMDVDLATGAVEGPQGEGVKEKSKKEKKKRPKKSKSKAEGEEDKLPRATTSALPTVSRMMVGTMRDVAKKGTLRMDPSVKRTMCKGCCAVLIPGVNCRVRIKPSGPHAHIISSTCSNCNRRLSLPAPPHLAEVTPGDHPVEGGEIASEAGVIRTKRERREQRQARRPTFFEREGHVTFCGDIKVVRM